MPENTHNLILPPASLASRGYRSLDRGLKQVLVVGAEQKKKLTLPQLQSALVHLGRFEKEVNQLDISIESQMRRAREIMGKENYYGPEAIEGVFGFDVPIDQIPPINFSERKLKQAFEKGLQLVLRWGNLPNGEQLNLKNLRLFWETVWKEKYKFTDTRRTEPFIDRNMVSVRAGWVLVGPYEDPIHIPNFKGKVESNNYILSVIKDFLNSEKVIRDVEDSQRIIMENVSNGLRPDCIMNVSATKKYLPNLAEVLYDLVLMRGTSFIGNVLTNVYNLNSKAESVFDVLKFSKFELDHDGDWCYTLAVQILDDMVSCDNQNVCMIINEYSE